MNLKNIIDKYFIKRPKLRKFITAILEPDCDVDVSIAGATLRINRRREHGYLRASRILQYNGTLRDEVPVLMNLFALARDGDTFVDVGANVGLYTYSFSRLASYHPNFRVIAFEANPDTFNRLSSQSHKNVEYHNIPVSDRKQELEFVDGAVSHVFTTKEKSNAYNIKDKLIKVQADTLDNLIGSEKSIILKIDVEGQELNVLKGAGKLLASNAIRIVYIDGYDDPEVQSLLQSHGFIFYDGRTLERVHGMTHSLLAIKPSNEIIT